VKCVAVLFSAIVRFFPHPAPRVFLGIFWVSRRSTFFFTWKQPSRHVMFFPCNFLLPFIYLFTNSFRCVVDYSQIPAFVTIQNLGGDCHWSFFPPFSEASPSPRHPPPPKITRVPNPVLELPCCDSGKPPKRCTDETRFPPCYFTAPIDT